MKTQTKKKSAPDLLFVNGEAYVKPTDDDRKLWLKMSQDATRFGFSKVAKELYDAATKPSRFLLRGDTYILSPKRSFAGSVPNRRFKEGITVKRLYCKYCGAKLRRDSCGQYCPTRNCQWQHGLPTNEDTKRK